MTDDRPHRHRGLPPRPDPETGEPFPPHGLGWTEKDRTPEEDRNRELRVSHKPSPPEGRGPVLAWHKSNKRGKVTLFFGSLALIVLGGSLLRAGEGRPAFDGATHWQPWLVALVGALIITRPATYLVLSAGADWVQLHTITFGVTRRHQVVDVYALEKISADIVAGGAGLALELKSQSGWIRLVRHEWQSDRRIWDLVYNGILHSVAAGAEVNPNARGMLELSQVPELRYPDGPRKIDVTRLSDAHVWQIMEDPNIRHLCDVIDFHGSAAGFRKRFPELTEDMLTEGANHAWFAETDDQTPTDNPHERS